MFGREGDPLFMSVSKELGGEDGYVLFVIVITFLLEAQLPSVPPLLSLATVESFVVTIKLVCARTLVLLDV